MKTFKIELNEKEISLLYGGLGWYYDRLEQMQHKEKSMKRRKELEIVKEDIEKLKSVLSKTF